MKPMIVWAIAQHLPSIAIVFASKDLRALSEIVGAVFDRFSAFCLVAVFYWLHHQEAATRRALRQANAQLLATRAAIVESSVGSERVAHLARASR